jgi:hypothetical protein
MSCSVPCSRRVCLLGHSTAAGNDTLRPPTSREEESGAMPLANPRPARNAATIRAGARARWLRYNASPCSYKPKVATPPYGPRRRSRLLPSGASTSTCCKVRTFLAGKLVAPLGTRRVLHTGVQPRTGARPDSDRDSAPPLAPSGSLVRRDKPSSVATDGTAPRQEIERHGVCCGARRATTPQARVALGPRGRRSSVSRPHELGRQRSCDASRANRRDGGDRLRDTGSQGRATESTSARTNVVVLDAHTRAAACRSASAQRRATKSRCRPASRAECRALGVDALQDDIDAAIGAAGPRPTSSWPRSGAADRLFGPAARDSHRRAATASTPAEAVSPTVISASRSGVVATESDSAFQSL